MSEMVERIKAIVAASPRPVDTGRSVSKTIGDLLYKLEYDGYLHDGEDVLGEIVRLTIAAMREPTEVMVKAGARAMDSCWSLEPGEGLDEDPAEPIWNAMVDAAVEA